MALHIELRHLRLQERSQLRVIEQERDSPEYAGISSHGLVNETARQTEITRTPFVPLRTHHLPAIDHEELARLKPILPNIRLPDTVKNYLIRPLFDGFLIV
ncbi:hypothetical protein [Burkholderia stabilis]|uniref:hypothetical protein n=1 Tax=Burkholderia stabilis TaxID=95485 RepID=UPI0012FE026E|nr:hypothetical protein [Burkholderia stabilis]